MEISLNVIAHSGIIAHGGDFLFLSRKERHHFKKFFIRGVLGLSDRLRLGPDCGGYVLMSFDGETGVEEVLGKGAREWMKFVCKLFLRFWGDCDGGESSLREE